MKTIQKCKFAAMKPTVQLARAISCLHASSIACAADVKASLHFGNTEFSAQVCSDLRLISREIRPVSHAYASLQIRKILNISPE